MATPRRQRLLFAALCVATLGGACWQRHAETNEERAYVSADGNRYRVEMRGWRFPLVHDPLSFLLGRTYQTTLTMDLPRIEGVVDGREIPVPPGKLGYAGRVVITGRKMTVDLYYDERDSPRHPLPWNDKYTLIQRD